MHFEHLACFIEMIWLEFELHGTGFAMNFLDKVVDFL